MLEGAFRFFEIGDQTHTAAVMRLAVVRETHSACGALQQACAQPFLHAFHQIGDGGAWHLQIVGGLREAVPFGDPHEDLHFLKAIHERGRPCCEDSSIVEATGTMILSPAR